MPVRRFKRVEDMEDALWRERGPELFAAIRRVWTFADRPVRLRFPHGVYRHRSVDAKNAVVTQQHARELGGIAAVRNRIAHGYASVDPGRLWDELPAGLDALDRYVDAIARHVGDSTS